MKRIIQERWDDSPVWCSPPNVLVLPDNKVDKDSTTKFYYLYYRFKSSAFNSSVAAFLFTTIYCSQPRIIGKKQKAHVFYTEN